MNLTNVHIFSATTLLTLAAVDPEGDALTYALSGNYLKINDLKNIRLGFIVYGYFVCTMLKL